MATFKKRYKLAPRKNESEPGRIIPNLSERLQFFWSHSSVFALEKQAKNLNFQSFFTSKLFFGGYFQQNECTQFEKICI